MRKLFLLLFLITNVCISVFAQVPEGYYDSAEGKSGAELKTALFNIVKDHNSITYPQLWTAFENTDKKENGNVWDMYSDIPGNPPYEYSFFTNQCGNYSKEGDCYNREHSLPISWFGSLTNSPMYTDLFHIYPTDGFVNGKRANYPFGETVNNPSWTSMNGSKLGNSKFPGYTGIVFEPIDEYKGDFARSYFYMVTRYEDRISGWNSDMLNKSTFPAFTEWTVNLLIKWHKQDPVSFKEIERNNAVYQIQNNRNPFIDRPEFAECIWEICNFPLLFTSEPVTSVYQNELYSYEISTTGGANGSTRFVDYIEKPDWLMFTPSENGEAILSGISQNIGNFEVQLSVTDGFSFEYQIFNIDVLEQVAIHNSTFSNDDFDIFIDPLTKEIMIKSDKSVLKVEIYNFMGQQVTSYVKSNMKKGIYILKIYFADKVISQKIVI